MIGVFSTKVLSVISKKNLMHHTVWNVAFESFLHNKFGCFITIYHNIKTGNQLLSLNRYTSRYFKNLLIKD